MKEAKGITLISLAITIIVLLILAGITIGTLTGENGIIQKAKEAALETRGASVEEAKQMWELEKQLGTGKELSELLDELEDQGLLIDGERGIIEETGEITIGSKTIVFGTGGNTLVKAIETGEIKIGDYVNFTNPTSGSYTVTADKVGLGDLGGQTIDNPNQEQKYEITASKNQLNWRVLGVENGKAKLIAGSPLESDVTVDGKKAPYLFMYGAKSYTEGYKELDKICDRLYGSLPLVSEARSVNMKDINEITGITDENKIKEVNLDPIMNDGKQYGEAYSFDNQYTPESWLNGKQQTTVSGNVDGYMYAINSQEEGMPTVTVSDQRQYDMLFKNVEYPNGAQYWLASRGVRASDYASFGLGMVSTGGGVTLAGTYALFDSDDGYENDVFAGVRPVVLLDSEVTTDQIYKIEDKTDPVWNYDFQDGE